MNTDTVYWRWTLGSYSSLHRVHPRYEGITWCGAIHREGVGHGVVEAYTDGLHTDLGIEPCAQCAKLRMPVFILPFEPPDVQVEYRERRKAARAAQRERRKVKVADKKAA